MGNIPTTVEYYRSLRTSFEREVLLDAVVTLGYGSLKLLISTTLQFFRAGYKFGSNIGLLFT